MPNAKRPCSAEKPPAHSSHAFRSRSRQNRGASLPGARARAGRRVPLVCGARGAHSRRRGMGPQQCRRRGRSAGARNKGAAQRNAGAIAAGPPGGAGRQRGRSRSSSLPGHQNLSHRRSLVMSKARLNSDELKKLIREVPDFPKKGILFYDITTLLKDKAGYATLIDLLAERYIGKDVDLVLGMEARGFIFGPALAYRLNAGFVPVRKPNKLPADTAKWDYKLEYGTGTLEIHKDAIKPGQKVIVVDDLLATGGTAEATVELAKSLGADIAGLGFVVELDFLKGRERLRDYDVFSLLKYSK